MTLELLWTGIGCPDSACLSMVTSAGLGVGQIHLMMTTKTLQGECSIKAFGIEPRHQRSNQLS